MARVGDGLDFSSTTRLRLAVALISVLAALIVLVQDQPLTADLIEGAMSALIVDYLLRNAARYGKHRVRDASRG